MKPSDKSPTWKGTTALERVQDAISLLLIHGFLTPAEVKRAEARLVKWIRRSCPGATVVIKRGP